MTNLNVGSTVYSITGNATRTNSQIVYEPNSYKETQ